MERMDDDVVVVVSFVVVLLCIPVGFKGWHLAHTMGAEKEWVRFWTSWGGNRQRGSQVGFLAQKSTTPLGIVFFFVSPKNGPQTTYF